MGVDKTRNDDLVRKLIDDVVGEFFRHFGKGARPFYATFAVHHYRTVVISNDTTLYTRIIPKTERPTPNHPRVVHGATSFSRRKRNMRQTLSKELANSVSRSLPTRASNDARILSFVAPFTANIKGKAKRVT